jgi:hypothetical protein
LENAGDVAHQAVLNQPDLYFARSNQPSVASVLHSERPG